MASGRDIGPPLRPGTTQIKAIPQDTSAIITTAFGSSTHIVRLSVDYPCHIAFAAAATLSDMYLPADEPEYFICSPGQKVAAITISGGTAAILNVTEMTR